MKKVNVQGFEWKQIPGLIQPDGTREFIDVIVRKNDGLTDEQRRARDEAMFRQIDALRKRPG